MFGVAPYLQSKPGTLCLAPHASRPDGTVLMSAIGVLVAAKIGLIIPCPPRIWVSGIALVER